MGVGLALIGVAFMLVGAEASSVKLCTIAVIAAAVALFFVWIGRHEKVKPRMIFGAFAIIEV